MNHSELCPGCGLKGLELSYREFKCDYEDCRVLTYLPEE